jgi:hypothetical protein
LGVGPKLIAGNVTLLVDGIELEIGESSDCNERHSVPFLEFREIGANQRVCLIKKRHLQPVISDLFVIGILLV